jgi:16S rRNA (guanine527-N7)-methyltransferase
VKHSDANPETIGRTTRALVEAWLRDHRVDSIDSRFGGRMEKLASAIALWGLRMNLTAEPSQPADLAFHVLDSLAPLILAAQSDGLALGHALGKDSRVLDLGAGAGFPGLVLAAAASAQFVLAEARRKRASFLTVTAGEMGLRNVSVESSQLVPATIMSTEMFAKSGGFDTVVARAFARPSEFHRMAAAALKAGGVAILYANQGQELGAGAAGSAGMGQVEEFPSSIGRDGRNVDRVLAVWRKVGGSKHG